MVDLVDDLEVARQKLFEEADRPGLERLGHQRVVGVGEGPRSDRPRRGPSRGVDRSTSTRISSGIGDGGMGVVQLDRDLVRQVVQVRVIFGETAEDVLQRRADEEVLLLKPQFPAP